MRHVGGSSSQVEEERMNTNWAKNPSRKTKMVAGASLAGAAAIVLGGIAAFGLVGLFIGPVILAVLMAVWREWLGFPHPHIQVPARVK